MTDRLDPARRYMEQHLETTRPDGVTQVMKYMLATSKSGTGEGVEKANRVMCGELPWMR